MARRVPLLALYAADAISVSGNVMAIVAIPWFVLELTGSAAIAGFVSEEYGVITAVVAIAAAYLLVTLSIFLNPAMRAMDRAAPDRAPAAPA